VTYRDDLADMCVPVSSSTGRRTTCDQLFIMTW